MHKHEFIISLICMYQGLLFGWDMYYYNTERMSISSTMVFLIHILINICKLFRVYVC